MATYVNNKLARLVLKLLDGVEKSDSITVKDISIISGNTKNIFTEDEITDLYVKYAPDRVRYANGHNLFWDLSEAILGKRLLCDGTKHIEDRSGYFIAAPKEHFDLNGLTKNEQNKGFYKRTSVVYKDPIVFRYVKGGIQVISKWGLEGNDEALQVGILN